MPGQSPYPRALNLRMYVPDRIETRPGQSLVSTGGVLAVPVHSLRRLNDSIPGAALPFTRVAGASTSLFTGQVAFGVVATGFTGNPLSMVPYRPDQSPEPWMYIADSSKMGKVRVDATFQNMG